MMRESLVLDHMLLTDAQLNDAIAISQASPGPLGLYVVVVGYFIAGLGGAVAGVLALATPAFLAIPSRLSSESVSPPRCRARVLGSSSRPAA
jgi:chromate transporter